MSKPTVESLQKQIDELKKEINGLNSFMEETRKYILERMSKENPPQAPPKPFKGIVKSKTH